MCSTTIPIYVSLTFSVAMVKHDVSPYSLVYQHEKCVVKPWNQNPECLFFSRVTSKVSHHNKQCPARPQAILPPIASNAVGFCPQSPRVWLTNPPSIACNSHEYCLQSPRVLLVWLASRTSVSREPHKCGTGAVQVWKQQCAGKEKRGRIFCFLYLF